MSQTVILTMIVKNEAHIIERCLASVRGLVTSYAIVDTGSTDGTQDVIRRAMEGIPGEVHDRPWRGFGASRTEAFELAAGKADYALVMDADDVLEVPPGFTMPTLTDDCYFLELRRDGVTFRRTQLFKLSRRWRYVGVLHEYADCDGPVTRGDIRGPLVHSTRDGARAKDPDRYRRDAEILEQAMREEPDNARHVFYAAQSWRDAGDDARARDLYLKRAAMGGFEEEAFCALYEAAKSAERIQAPRDVVIGSYLAAYQARPKRAEPLVDVARYCRVRGEHALAFLFAEAAARITSPIGELLFVALDVYAWRALDELAIAAYWTGRHELAREINERLLHDRRVPEADLARIRDNLGWAERGLAQRKQG